MLVWKLGIVALAWIAGSGAAAAAELRAEMHRATASGPGEAVGTVTVADSAQGAVVKTDLNGLPAGPHGFHVHENGSCQPATANGDTVPAGAGVAHHMAPCICRCRGQRRSRKTVRIPQKTCLAVDGRHPGSHSFAGRLSALGRQRCGFGSWE